MRQITTLLLMLLFFRLGLSTLSSTIHVAVVACGTKRAQETLALLRSILLSTSSELCFHLIHKQGDGNDVLFQTLLDQWKMERMGSRFDYQLYVSYFPLAVYETLFAPCACQRLFLHHLLPANIDRVIYLDSDMLMLSDIEQLWKQFDIFVDGTTLAALAPEDEPTQIHHYYTNDRVDFPFVQLPGKAHGLNSGVMLLNLKLLRRKPWDKTFNFYLTKYQLTFYDQDLLNIYFALHSEQLQLLSCAFNFRPDHCYFVQQHCSGIQLLHGNRGVFHKESTTSYPVLAFQIVYSSFAGNATKALDTCRQVQDRLHELIRASEGQQYDNQCEIAVLSVVLYQLPETCRSAQLAAAASNAELPAPEL